MITGALVKTALKIWANKYAADNNLTPAYGLQLYNFLANKLLNDSMAKWFMLHAHEYNFLDRKVTQTTASGALYVYKDLLDLRDWNLKESIAQFWEYPITKWYGMDAVRNPDQWPDTFAYQNGLRLWQVDLSAGRTYQDDILINQKETIGEQFNFNFNPVPGGTPGPGGTTYTPPAPGQNTTPPKTIIPKEAGLFGADPITIVYLIGAGALVYFLTKNKRR